MKKISKKETRKIVFKKLSDAMAEYKNALKEKKVVNNLKKVSKIFAADIVKAAVKQNRRVKKNKKQAKVKTEKTNALTQTA
jgi:hypothetical protein